MAATQVGVIYSTINKVLRRIIFPDDDGELPLHLGAGETMHTVSADEWSAERDTRIAAKTNDHDPTSLSAHFLKVHKAITLGDPRCAVADPTGTVIGHIMADPLLDKPHLPGHTLHNTPGLQVGDKIK